MFFFSSRRRHTRYWRDWSSDVCSSDLWVLYRSTAEALKHEKFLFLSCAGPYATADRLRVLAERVEGLVSQEHAKWTQGREQAEPARRRSEERRVGKEWRSRWSPYHYKKENGIGPRVRGGTSSAAP